MFFEETEFEELKDFLVERYGFLYAVNDKAHQIDHVLSVADLALEINETLKLNLDRRLIVIPAITHDLFTWSRSNHHYLAQQWLKTLNEGWINHFASYELETMANAVYEHRASYRGEYSSIVSELIASADRGKPHSINDTVHRAYLYATDKLKLSHADAKVKAVEHVKEKFGKKGYTKYPELYLRMFSDDLIKFQEAVDNLTLDYFYGLK